MAEGHGLETSSGPRTAILNAAMRLFGKQGYSGTSVRDLATEVGVLPGSLYAHIQSKEALLVEIVADGIHRFITAVEPHAYSAGSPAERLRAMIVAHVEVVAENPERSLVVFHQWRFLGEENLPAAIERRQAYEGCFIKVVEDGVAQDMFKQDINQRIAVFTILGALNWTPEWLSPSGRLSPQEVGVLMAETLMRGVLA
jgi:hypothetical protein